MKNERERYWTNVNTRESRNKTSVNTVRHITYNDVKLHIISSSWNTGTAWPYNWITPRPNNPSANQPQPNNPSLNSPTRTVYWLDWHRDSGWRRPTGEHTTTVHNHTYTPILAPLESSGSTDLRDDGVGVDHALPEVGRVAQDVARRDATRARGRHHVIADLGHILYYTVYQWIYTVWSCKQMDLYPN